MANKRRIIEHENGRFTVEKKNRLGFREEETEFLWFPLDMDVPLIFDTYEEAKKHIDKKNWKWWEVKKIYNLNEDDND